MEDNLNFCENGRRPKYFENQDQDDCQYSISQSWKVAMGTSLAGHNASIYATTTRDSLNAKQPLTATNTMPDLSGAVAKMRERMARMSSSLGEEKPKKNIQQAKNVFANLITKFTVQPSPIKMPKATKFLSQYAQQPVRLPKAIPSYHAQLPRFNYSQPPPE